MIGNSGSNSSSGAGSGDGRDGKGRLIGIEFVLTSDQTVNTQVAIDEAVIIERALLNPAIRGMTIRDTDDTHIFINCSHVVLAHFMPLKADRSEWDD